VLADRCVREDLPFAFSLHEWVVGLYSNVFLSRLLPENQQDQQSCGPCAQSNKRKFK
jgi:hypothetical protein